MNYNFLDETTRGWLQAHKGATIEWGNNKLTVKYQKEINLTSAGFRIEHVVEPNVTYQLEIEARLLFGDPAFVYVEDVDGNRLMTRFKIYRNNAQPYRLKHNFISGNSRIYLGILFYYPDQDYELEVTAFSLTRVAQLTSQNLINFQTEVTHIPSVMTGEMTTRPVPDLLTNETPVTLPTIGDLHSSWLNETLPPKKIGVGGKLVQPPKVFNPAAANFQPSLHNNSTPSISYPDNQSVAKTSVATKPVHYEPASPVTMADLEKAAVEDDEDSTWGSNVTMPSLPNFDIHGQINRPPIVPPVSNISVDSLLNQKAAHALLPAKLTRSLIEKMKIFLKQQGRQIVISLTTTPSRMGKVRQVVDSLLKQSLPIDFLFLIVPHHHKRTSKPYFIHKKWYLKSDPRIKIVRTADVGPMTKLHPILDVVNDSAIILTADDDYLYPKHWAFYLSYLAITKPAFKAVYSFKGYLNQRVTSKREEPTNLDWFTGDWGVCIARKWVRKPEKMLKQVSFSQEAFFSDDVLTSNHLASYNVARILLPLVTMPQVYPRKMEWAGSYDSLHRMNPPQDLRYFKVCQTLQKRKYYFLNKMGAMLQAVAETNSDGTRKPLGEIEDESTIGGVTALKPLNPNEGLAQQRIRYISYLTDVNNPDYMLMYLRHLPRAILELPKVDYQHTSLPQDYADWFKPMSNYDLMIVDLPFCVDRSPIKIKHGDKPVYYIYRNPELGDVSAASASTVIVSQSQYGGNFFWRPALDLAIKPGGKWRKDHKHLAMIVTVNHYVANLDLLFDFWSKHCQDLKVQLHIGVADPMSQQIQTLVNELGIRNIKVYNQSKIFGSLIYYSDYYFNLGFYCDHYALWAYQKGKTLLMMKYGEFEELPNLVGVPFTLGKIQLCREYLFESHQACTGGVGGLCQVYGHSEAENVPIVAQAGLKQLMEKLFESSLE